MKANRVPLLPTILTLVLSASACATDHGSDPAPAPPTSTGPIGAANVPFVDTIDVTGSRAQLEAARGEIRRILEDAVGAEGWTERRPAQEVACPSRTVDSGGLDDGIGKFYAPEMTHPEPLADGEGGPRVGDEEKPHDDDNATWADVRAEIVRAVEPHGFRPKNLGPAGNAEQPDPVEDAQGPDPAGAADGARYLYLISPHQDELTVSTHPDIGSGYGGFGVCHPWGG